MGEGDSGTRGADRTLPIIRVYDTARTVHLERLRIFRPGAFYFRKVSYDFEAALVPAVSAVRLPRYRTAIRLLRAPQSTLELNEPAQLNAWPSVALYLAVNALRAVIGRRPHRVVAYAIDNSDVAHNARSYRWVGLRPPRSAVLMLFRTIVRRYDTLAFGSEGAQEHYARYAALPTHRTISALPSRPAAAPPESTIATLLFLGSFEERKGVLQVMSLWPQLKVRLPQARLIIAGKGPYEDAVRAWAGRNRDVSVVVDPDLLDKRDAFSRATALILLSRRTSRWREQIGLPIVEGLRAGCEIITTTETGLASWLTEHQHQVLHPDARCDEVIDGVAKALSHPRTRADVLADLPHIDGRFAADRYLMDGWEVTDA